MRTIYYSDPYNDDFANNNIKTKNITEVFRYINNNMVWKMSAFILYHIIACPLVFLYCKILYGIKIDGKRNINKIKDCGSFIYGNHTHIVDSFIPSILSGYKRKGYVISSSDAVSIPGFKNIVLMLGAIPIPTTINGMRVFLSSIHKRIISGASVTVYPEAHIWPYYTGIRPFKNKSFYYPVKFKVPVVAFCNTYSKRKIFRFIKVPRMKVYVSEPMYPEETLPLKEAEEELRDRVYNFMKSTAEKYSTYEYVKYVQQQVYAGNNIQR